MGWNDFGGKSMDNEDTYETAAREFSEETSCLFYLNENEFEENRDQKYSLLKDNLELAYNDDTVDLLLELLPKSQQYYVNRIKEFATPLYINSKEMYISYLIKVAYIPAEDLPRAEDIHIPYEMRYLRTCRWFSFTDLMQLHERDFHKRLLITKIQCRIREYYEKGLFI